MAFAWQQSLSNSLNNPAQAFVPTSGGNLLIWTSVSSIGGGSPIASVRDNNGTVWPIAVPTASDGKGNYRTIAYLPNCSPGITTVTATYSGGTPGLVITSITEYSGIGAVTPLIGAAVSTIVTPGTGAQAIVVPPLSVITGLPALLFSALTDYIAAGSNLVGGFGSFTSRGVVGAATLIQDQRITSGASISPTATDAVRGAIDSYLGFTAAFSENTTGALTPSGLVFVMP